jgi:hypothetical protein
MRSGGSIVIGGAEKPIIERYKAKSWYKQKYFVGS